MNETKEMQLKTALSQWATQNAIRPAAFAKRMGYTPSYGWSLLRGQAGVTPEAFGRFVLAYGTEAASQVLALANYPTETLPASHGAQTVPVVSVSSGPLGA